MRVLWFSNNSSNHNKRFLEKLSLFGHQVWFLDVTSRELPPWVSPPGVTCIQPRCAIPGSASPDTFESLLPEFRFWLKEIQPHLVQAGPVQTCGYLAALSGFHPLVVMSWGSDLLLDANRNEEWRNATETALKGADGLFCDCQTVRAAAGRFVAFTDSRVALFPYGIERDSFGPHGPLPASERFAPEPAAIYFLCTRSWEPLYDMDVLLDAFVRAHRKNKSLRLVLLGDGSTADQIRQFIVQNELTEVVLTPGVVQRDELPHWFRAANAYISCAKSDGSSISLLEAMATGLPVIVTDIPSNREWVTEDENGWLAPVGAAEKFAEQLLKAASLKPAQQNLISHRNRLAVSERADWDQNFPRLMNLYKSLV